MGFELFGRRIARIGVVGSGNIGPDIALHFSKVGHRAGAAVAVTDVAQAALDSGRDRTAKKLQKGVETGAFKPAEAEAILGNISFSTDKSTLAGCDLVVEAATERLPIKRSIVADLERLCGPEAILASNSSHLEPEEIFAEAKRPERGLVIHYFFPAERNPLVEVVPGERTSPEVADFCTKFYETIGKIPVRIKSRYGYAVDPIFEGLFQAAALCAQEGLASPKQIDAIAVRALGLGVGPFTAMNLTGGNPITQAGLNEYHEKIFAWFKSPRILDEQIESGKPWEAAGKGESVTYSDEQYGRVSERLMGAYFAIAGNVIDAGLVGIGDLELAVEIGLVMTPPFRLMNQIGTDRALGLIREQPVPECLRRQVPRAWRVPFVLREDRSAVAVLTIKRPRNLNALNVELMDQLREHVEAIRVDSKIRAAVITGFGVKAFVSGADIDMLSSVRTPEEGIATSKRFQDILIGLEDLGKPTVCAMNGLAFGGGLELAQACTARIARPGVDPFAAQPEVKLGIIPGAGGTQRLPRLIGFANALWMLRTGNPISSERAKEWGLLHRLAEGDLVAEAVRMAERMASGSERVPEMNRGPIETPAALPPVDLGTLSRRIDEILCRAVVEGARLGLSRGLELETRLWGEVCATEDMRVGLENFKKTALRSPAAFVHR
jgi:enoyl-CoA hydratase/3-hydroxyacyl-CoA dehydrogenase